MRIAVVIPTLNEAANLPATLAALQQGRPDAVVVADCESADGTVEVAGRCGVGVIHGRGLSSRAAALQAGYEHHQAATPAFDVVFFLHADTVPPANWRQVIEQTLHSPAVVGGAFAQRFSFRERKLGWHQRRLLRFVTFCNRTRYAITGIYFGDQGIFARTAALAQIGGIPQAPLMEDVDLCRRLKAVGRLRVSRTARLSTSPRRFLKHGIVRQLLHDWFLLTLHHFDINPQTLHQRYNNDNRIPPPEVIPGARPDSKVGSSINRK